MEGRVIPGNFVYVAEKVAQSVQKTLAEFKSGASEFEYNYVI